MWRALSSALFPASDPTWAWRRRMAFAGCGTFLAGIIHSTCFDFDIAHSSMVMTNCVCRLLGHPGDLRRPRRRRRQVQARHRREGARPAVAAGRERRSPSVSPDSESAPDIRRPRMQFNEHDRVTLARTLYGEARGEPTEGQIAVAWVILLSLEGAVAQVCLAPWQFSCWNQGDPNRARLLVLRADQCRGQMGAASNVLAGLVADPTAWAGAWPPLRRPADRRPLGHQAGRPEHERRPRAMGLGRRPRAADLRAIHQLHRLLARLHPRRPLRRRQRHRGAGPHTPQLTALAVRRVRRPAGDTWWRSRT
jgi:N-acetylmuramoyl-L-alanine amidase